MNILGLHISGSNSSAALLKKGKIIYATTEERISRIKYDVDFPEMAINKCLSKAKIKMDEAKQRLQDGPGSLTKKVEKMKKLGRLSTKKELPDDLEDDIH